MVSVRSRAESTEVGTISNERDGRSDGLVDGSTETEGFVKGCNLEGLIDGRELCCFEGETEGAVEGCRTAIVGNRVPSAESLGALLGALLGEILGILLGSTFGFLEGNGVSTLGALRGEILKSMLGAPLGFLVENEITSEFEGAFDVDNDSDGRNEGRFDESTEGF